MCNIFDRHTYAMPLSINGTGHQLLTGMIHFEMIHCLFYHFSFYCTRHGHISQWDHTENPVTFTVKLKFSFSLHIVYMYLILSNKEKCTILQKIKWADFFCQDPALSVPCVIATRTIFQAMSPSSLISFFAFFLQILKMWNLH